MNELNLSAIIHVAGFATGVVLYAMLAVMSAREREAPRLSRRLAILAGVLGVAWNAGSLIVYGLRDFALASPPPLFVAATFVCLAFLPGVVVHASLSPAVTARGPRLLVASGYVLSGVAAILHLRAALDGIAPSRSGLLVLTSGYSLVVLSLALLAIRQPDSRKSLGMVLLAAFAVSALHLTHAPNQPDSWITALLGHHASIPLVVVMLYYDYRYAFADVFLRQALALVALVALTIAFHAFLTAPAFIAIGTTGRGAMVYDSLHIGLWVVTALLYPWIYRGVGRFVDRAVLRRGDYRSLRNDIALAVSRAQTEADALDQAGSLIAEAVSARTVRWHPTTPSERSGDLPPARDSDQRGVTLRVPVAEPPGYDLEVGELRGGRRLLSDDLLMLEAVTGIVARRVDVLRVTQERHARDLREQDITRQMAEAELRALRAQLNPHFLFNALTTIGFLINTAPRRATRALYRLTDLLRAVLRRHPGQLTTLGDELAICEAYLEIERERFEERLQVDIDVPAELKRATVLPLVIQPLVENAVKHGITPHKAGGSVRLAARAEGQTLIINVENTGSGFEVSVRDQRDADGLGLASVVERLRSAFGRSASLEVGQRSGGGTACTIRLPLRFAAANPGDDDNSLTRREGSRSTSEVGA